MSSMITVANRIQNIGQAHAADDSFKSSFAHVALQSGKDKKFVPFPTLVCHTPDGCRKASKSAASSALYDHAVHMLKLNPKSVLTLEDSKSGASSAALTGKMKAIGFNPTKDPKITEMLYNSGSQLVVYTHAEYNEVMRREATHSVKSLRSRFSLGEEKRKIFNDTAGMHQEGRDYFNTPKARLTNRPAKAFAPDVDGVIFDSEPKVADAVVEALHAASVPLTPQQEQKIRHDIVGTSLDIMRDKVLPPILGEQAVPPNFKTEAGQRIIEKYKSIEAIDGAIATLEMAVKFFGKKRVTPVSNAMPDETTTKFAAHNIKTIVDHGEHASSRIMSWMRRFSPNVATRQRSSLV